MKKLLSLVCLLCLLAPLALFTGCSCKSDVPPDHQLASKPAVDGYTLYLPEEWKVDRDANGLITAQVSSVNTFSFVASRVETTHESMTAYWAESEAEIKSLVETKPSDPEDPASAPASTYLLEDSGNTQLKKCGKLAYFYEYTAIFPTKPVRYRVLQYFILIGNTPADGMIVLTLSGSDEAKETTGDKDFNDDMRQKLVKILEVIEIGTATDEGEVPDLSFSDENAPAGMKNATRNEHIGMTVYVPETWKVPESDGFIGVISPDGKANIGITNLSITGGVGVQNTLAARMEYYGIEMFDKERGFTLIDYWNLTKAEYGAYFDDGSFTVLKEPVTTEKKDEEGNVIGYTTDPPPTEAGETTYYTYTFTGKHKGETYECTFYVFRATKDRKNQFRTLLLMTHDATHAEYIPVAEKILAEVRY